MGKGHDRRRIQKPNWLHLDEISRSTRMVAFRVNDDRTRYVPLKEVEAWEAKHGE